MMPSLTRPTWKRLNKKGPGQNSLPSIITILHPERQKSIYLRLSNKIIENPLSSSAADIFANRKEEATLFYHAVLQRISPRKWRMYKGKRWPGSCGASNIIIFDVERW